MIDDLINKIKGKEVVIGIIVLGYVELPLAKAFLTSGFREIGFEVDKVKVNMIDKGCLVL